MPAPAGARANGPGFQDGAFACEGSQQAARARSRTLGFASGREPRRGARAASIRRDEPPDTRCFQRSRSNAVSRNVAMVAADTRPAPIKYKAGDSGLPVRWMSQVAMNGANPPNTATASA